MPYGAVPQIGKDYSAAMKGKVMLDACNAVSTRDGTDCRRSRAKLASAVTTQKYFPGVRIVRAFNTMSYMVFAREANRPDPKLAIPIAGRRPAGHADRGCARARRRLRSGHRRERLPTRGAFQRGQAGYGQQVTAAELKQKLSLP